MRFTLTMPDDLVEQIDEEAERTGKPRAEWIRQACTDALHPPAPGPTPEEHQAHQVEVIELRTRTAYLEQTIADLRADKEYLRGEIARVQQENSLLTHRLLPPPRAGGVVSRIRRWWSGSGEE
jgi:metal-responsive CopG/Arc/MetJ family transcriptional regulator